MRTLARSSGVLRVETDYHCWSFLLQGGLVWAAEEDRALETIARKLRAQKFQLPQVPQPSSNLRFPGYSLIVQAFRQQPDATSRALESLLLETFLALHLETTFSFVWEPSAPAELAVPTWPLTSLAQAANREARQWQNLQQIRHPYQRIQLIDAAGLLARVGNQHFPLFARLTTGQNRLNEISDQLGQTLFRTAVFFDKLARNKTVEILPLTARQMQAPPEANPKRKVTTKLEPEIFVVDDSPVLLRQFRDLVTSWGYRVRSTDQAVEAVDIILDSNPAVIFLDINMPGASGFDLIKQIRRQPTLASTPLVLMTAEKSVANQWRAQWASCRFLAKPRTLVEANVFRTELRTFLRNLAPLSTDVLL